MSSVLNEIRFSQPENLAWGEFTNARGQTIRTASVVVAPARGVVLLLTGLSEFTEKYFETIRDLNARGLSVYTFDWISQGGSERGIESERSKIHVPDFTNYIDDLSQFIDEALPKNNFLILAHSMGGHLALRYLTTHTPPAHLRCAVLSAPMIDISISEKIPNFVVRILEKCISLTPQHYAPGATDWSLKTRNAPAGQSEFSSDIMRDQLHKAWSVEKQMLRTGGPTNAWLLAALQSIRDLKESLNSAPLPIPVLAQLAGDDKVVSTKFAKAALLPRAETIEIPRARHEILMERDEFRGMFWQNFDRFVETHLKISL